MNILITNDDSIHADQLVPLVNWCQQLGTVTVVVPKFEQSAKSHSIEIRSSFEIRKVDLISGVDVWTVDSTPADCVRFAAARLNTHFDLVISGVNRGYNLGRDILYSGTVAAASEAIHKGIPAIALSISRKYYDQAVTHLDRIFRFIKDHDLFAHNNLYNINIPGDPKGICITRQGGPSFSEEFIPMENNLYFPGGSPIKPTDKDESLDTVCVRQGYISITPLTTDRTNQAVFEKLSASLIESD